MVVLINTETHKVAIIWVVAIIGACTLYGESNCKSLMKNHSLRRTQWFTGLVQRGDCFQGVANQKGVFESCKINGSAM